MRTKALALLAAVATLGAGSAFGSSQAQPEAAAAGQDREIARQLRAIHKDLRAVKKDVRGIARTLGPDVLRDEDNSVIGRLTRIESIAHHACYAVASQITRDEYC
jgi:signal transduction histidine kinase